MTGTASGRIRVRRIYEPPATDDGTRILVDRLWPRGMSKERAKQPEISEAGVLQQLLSEPDSG